MKESSKNTSVSPCEPSIKPEGEVGTGQRPWTPGPWRWNDRYVVDDSGTVVSVEGIGQPHGYNPPSDPSTPVENIGSQAQKEEICVIESKQRLSREDIKLLNILLAIVAAPRVEASGMHLTDSERKDLSRIPAAAERLLGFFKDAVYVEVGK